MISSKVLIMGPIFVDLIFTGLHGLPEPGKEIYSDYFNIAPGGLAITAIGLARLGIDTGIVSVTGRDYNSEFICNQLVKEGINIEGLLKIKNQNTNFTVAFVYDGDRAFITNLGATLSQSELFKLREHLFNYKEINHVHMALEKNLEFINVLKTLKKRGVTTSVVTSWDSAIKYSKEKELLKELLPNIDIFFCNRIESKILTGKDNIIESLNILNQFTKTVITLGAKGAITLDERGGIEKTNVLPVKFVDPTGAGDAFVSGFIAGWIKKWPIKKCLKFGSICGSKSTEGVGGIEAFPSFQNAMKYL